VTECSDSATSDQSSRACLDCRLPINCLCNSGKSGKVAWTIWFGKLKNRASLPTDPQSWSTILGRHQEGQDYARLQWSAVLKVQIRDSIKNQHDVDHGAVVPRSSRYSEQRHASVRIVDTQVSGKACFPVQQWPRSRLRS
jgi:hypothetical protein